MSKLEKELTNEINQNIMKRDGSYVPRLVGITFSDAEGGIARKTWETFATSALSNFNPDLAGMKGGSEFISKSEVTTAMKWIEEKSAGVTWKKFDYGGDMMLVMMKGDKTITIPLTKELAAQIPLSDPRVSSPDYQQIVRAQAAYNGSTNAANVDKSSTPTDEYRTAYFRPDNYYMPNIKKLNVKADLTSDMTTSGKQYINLLLKTELGVLSLKLKDNPVDRDEALRVIHNLTDNNVKQVFLESDRVPENWKELIRNL